MASERMRILIRKFGPSILESFAISGWTGWPGEPWEAWGA